MKESAINYNIPVPSDNKPPEISQPRKSSFDFPATFISSHLAAIMVFTFLIVLSVWANQFNASLFQLFAIIITIVTFISYQPLRLLFRPSLSWTRHCDSVERFFEERNFTGGRRVQVVAQRNSFAVDHHHPLRSLAAFGFSDTQAPFLAGAKLPSINVSLQSNCPFSSSSERNARHIESHTFCSSQSLSRRQQVEALAYSFGKSPHGAPVRNIHRMPSKTLRLSTQGLPPLRFTLCLGKCFSILDHCFSVTLQRVLDIIEPPFNAQVYTIYIFYRKSFYLLPRL